MIIVQIHLKSANDGKTTKLAEMQICNDGRSIDPELGHYNAQIMRKPDFRQVTRDGHVENHRKLSKTVWHLVARMLIQMGYNK